MGTAAQRLRAIASATRRERVLINGFRGGGNGMDAAGDQLAALVDAVAVLSGVRVPFALIGGIAVGIHSGVPRATLDIDFAVASEVDRARLAGAMTEAGFQQAGEFEHTLNFRHASGEPVQLAIDPAFDQMIERAEHLEVGATSVPIVRKDDLIAMKERAAADPARRRSKALRDQADVELLRGDAPDPDEGW